jgi:hypothetical protein
MQADDSPGDGRRTTGFDLEAHAFLCVHPGDTGVMVIAEYSRRTPKGKPHGGERTEGEEFITSLMFTDIRR